MKKKNVLLIILVRTSLAILILLNMMVIFVLSSQNSKESTHTSDLLGSSITGSFIEDFDQKPSLEKHEINIKISQFVRKTAHMLEFGALGTLIYLFLLTWNGKIFGKYLVAVAIAAFYAGMDEWHQSLVPGRHALFSDVLIDALGALICCSFVLLICILIRKKGKHLKTTYYSLNFPDNSRRLRIAVAADLHGDDPQKPLELLRASAPDLILIPGDLMDDEDLRAPDASGYTFLQECAAIAPTYYSIGNHEIACYHRGNLWPVPIPLTDEIRARIAETGAVLLENESILRKDGIRICALTSGINGKVNKPDTDALATFAKAPEFRILMCHHPEYYAPYIRPTDIELTVCGHAHGGQWRIFGRGIFAPGQGLFPKYTSGVHDGRCVISRGLSNHTSIPRIFNPPEIVIIGIGYPPKNQNPTKRTKRNGDKKWLSFP